MRRRASLRGWAFAVAAAASMAATAPGAWAQQSNKVRAEALFDEALKLMDQKQYAQACPKFADSQRLDPAPGTLLNLANCYEKNGQVASAWETYKEASASARDAHNTQYMTAADQHVARLEKAGLPKMIITAESPAPGMVIKSDGSEVLQSEWGTPTPADPGTHHIEASAPNKKTWSGDVTVGPDAMKTPAEVKIPALEDAPQTETTPPAPTTSATTTPPPATTATTGVSTETPPPSSSQKTIAIVVGAVGIAGLATGGVFALIGKGKYNDSLDHCSPTDKNDCSAQGVSLRDDARSDGNIATIALGVGAAALIAGGILFFTAPSDGKSASSGSVQVYPTLGGAGVRGVF